MSDDFVTRLGGQLRAAAEREARRGPIARATVASRGRVVSRPVITGAALACVLAVVVAAALSALHYASPPVEEAVPPGHGLSLIAHGPLLSQGGVVASGFGAVWASDAGTGELLRVDPRSRRVLARVPLGGLAYPGVGAGAVWATVNGRLIRIDPTTNQVSARIPLGLGARAGGAVSPGRGVMWVGTPRELLRVDPRHNRIDRRIGLVRQAYEAQGWAIDRHYLYVLRADRVLLVLDAATGAQVSNVRLALDGFVMGVADGSVMLASGSEVAAVDARSGRTLWHVNLGAAQVNDAFVAGSSLWMHVTYTDRNRDRLVRLDVRNGLVTGSLTLPEFGVAGLAPVDGDVWIVSPNGRLVIAR